MNAIAGLGKYLFAIPFAVFGVMHFMNAEAMAGQVPFPGGVIWIYISGAALVLAAVSIFVGKKDGLATFLLGVLLLVYVIGIHVPGLLQAGDEAAQGIHLGNLLKDTSLAGASFMYARYAAKEAVK
jgi:uncharacterized membrane protein